MIKRNSWVPIIILVLCGLVFASSLAYYLTQQNQDKIVTPTDADMSDVDNDKPGILANVSGDDLAKIDVRHGFAVDKDVLYFVKNKGEAEIRAEITKPAIVSAQPDAGPTNKTPINPDTFAASQLMKWTKDKGVEMVADLNNVDKHPINRLSSLVENNSLYLFPCIPSSSDAQAVCEITKTYQFDLKTSKLALVNDFSTAPDKETQVKTLNKKYHFDDLGKPYWQDIRGGNVYGIKNIYNTENGSKTLTGYLMTTKDGITEKPLVFGSQLAKSDLKVNTKGKILIDQSGTLKISGTCVIEHRLLELNPDKPAEQQKAIIKKLNIDSAGIWNDGVVRSETEQKTWVNNCAKLPDYTTKTAQQLLQLNVDADTQIQQFE